MSLPKTYRRAVFPGMGQPLAVEEAPLRTPASNELLVKVEACGVCHSDMYSQYNALGAGFPIAPGHEIIGKVAAVGDAVAGWKVGDRVGGGWHGGHDGTCNACKQGWFNMCDHQAVNGATMDGGYAEYAYLRAEAGVRIPADVDAAKYAPLLCAGITVFNSMRAQKVTPGETVAVQGLGGLGHLAIQYAKFMGYRVVAVSRGADKEKAARALGAHEYVDSSAGDPGEQLKALGGAALVVSTAATSEAMAPLLKGLAIHGKLLVLGIPEKLEFPTLELLRYGCSVQVWPSGHQGDSEDTIAFSKLHGVDCQIERFPLARAREAYDAMMSGTVRFRSVITME
ncbi:dehydrogenase [Lasiosphaeria ovina]|uniref:Dehydrogenase n=1 Tax=Lasiosphaeria ovina TaxID=92902 RepID=A0AAE0NIV0_9PEZI|nr:dehydrogenase [Lasiosphaeria ovina]